MKKTINRAGFDEQMIMVDPGEVSITQDPDWSTVNFDSESCICLCAHDPFTRISGMTHIIS